MAPGDDASAHATGPRGDRATPRLRWAVSCWVAVLVLTGVVQVLRQQWFDTAFFFAAAALTAAGPWLPVRASRRVPRGSTAIGIVVVVGVGLSLLPRHSLWMVAALAVVGLAAILYAWFAPSDGMPAGRGWTPGLRWLGLAWVTAVIAGCLWELAQFILGYLKPDQRAYALSDLIDPLLDGWLGKAVFVAVWLAGGAFLLRRGRRLGRGDRT